MLFVADHDEPCRILHRCGNQSVRRFRETKTGDYGSLVSQGRRFGFS
jgi:hypothetical protein